METIDNYQNELTFETLVATLLYLISKYAQHPEPRLRMIIKQHLESLSVISSNVNMPTLCATTNKLIEQIWAAQEHAHSSVNNTLTSMH